MTIEGDQGRRLLAKARQLKERALGTADGTRRKQFLLIANEYEKLVEIDRRVPVIKRLNSGDITGGSPQHNIAHLRPKSIPAAAVHSEPHITDAEQGHQSTRVLELVLWAIVTLIAFSLVLIRGDQTLGGLRTIIDAF